jgi:copper chaperone CopZ
VTQAIQKVRGVTRVTVDFPKAEAQVESQRCSASVYQAIAANLATEGYGGQVTQVAALPQRAREDEAAAAPPSSAKSR